MSLNQPPALRWPDQVALFCFIFQIVRWTKSTAGQCVSNPPENRAPEHFAADHQTSKASLVLSKHLQIQVNSLLKYSQLKVLESAIANFVFVREKFA